VSDKGPIPAIVEALHLKSSRKSWQARADLAEDFRRRRPPNCLIFMAMRPYWPKETPPSILPPGEGTWQPPGIIASK
jgi:hypothetical protein